ncbi:MAG: hypothetical protein H7338_02210 [Candidatus Sericytochromatia bacterium]|nr:hypothetical protein [Candidatus Sericytochromatia bacterium]
MGIRSIRAARTMADEGRALAASISKAQMATTRESLALAEKTDSRVQARSLQQLDMQKDDLAAELESTRAKAITTTLMSVYGAVTSVLTLGYKAIERLQDRAAGRPSEYEAGHLMQTAKMFDPVRAKSDAAKVKAADAEAAEAEKARTPEQRQETARTQQQEQARQEKFSPERVDQGLHNEQSQSYMQAHPELNPNRVPSDASGPPVSDAVKAAATGSPPAHGPVFEANARHLKAQEWVKQLTELKNTASVRGEQAHVTGPFANLWRTGQLMLAKQQLASAEAHLSKTLDEARVPITFTAGHERGRRDPAAGTAPVDGGAGTGGAAPPSREAIPTPAAAPSAGPADSAGNPPVAPMDATPVPVQVSSARVDPPSATAAHGNQATGSAPAPAPVVGPPASGIEPVLPPPAFPPACAPATGPVGTGTPPDLATPPAPGVPPETTAPPPVSAETKPGPSGMARTGEYTASYSQPWDAENETEVGLTEDRRAVVAGWQSTHGGMAALGSQIERLDWLRTRAERGQLTRADLYANRDVFDDGQFHRMEAMLFKDVNMRFSDKPEMATAAGRELARLAGPTATNDTLDAFKGTMKEAVSAKLIVAMANHAQLGTAESLAQVKQAQRLMDDVNYGSEGASLGDKAARGLRYALGETAVMLCPTGLDSIVVGMIRISIEQAMSAAKLNGEAQNRAAVLGKARSILKKHLAEFGQTNPGIRKC